MLAYLDVWTFSGWSDNDAKPLGLNVWCETRVCMLVSLVPCWAEGLALYPQNMIGMVIHHDSDG